MSSLILYGRRFFELQKYRNLRIAVNIVQNAYAFSSVSAAADATLQDGRKVKNFTVSYLVDSLGLTTILAESISRKISFEDKCNPDSVLSLFRSHGFTDSQISNIITIYPGLLIADAERSLGHKLKFLQSRGATSSELTEILSKVPKILGIKKDKAISRYYDFAKEVIEADKSSKFDKLCLSSLPQGSAQENKIRNVSLLRELGMPQKLLFSVLTSNVQLVCGKDRFEESLKKVVEMGFKPTTSKFIEALRMVYGLSDKTIEGKVEVYKRLGFAVGDVWAIFKKCPASLIYSEMKIANSIETFMCVGYSRDEFAMTVKRFPQCIGSSAESLKKKIEFLVKKMNWPIKTLVSNPAVLGLSMEKRIIPRCNVIEALMSKGLLRRSEPPPVSSVLATTDKAFLNKYVNKHNDKELVPELMAIFLKSRVS